MQGRGLVFNEGERVEGYSNFLYILLLAPSFLFTDGMGIYAVALAVNLIFVILVYLLFVWHVGGRLGPDGASAAALLFAFCPVIWVWVASGLESVLVLLLQVLAWIALARLEEGRRGMYALLVASLVLSFLARADGFLVAAVVVLHLSLRNRWRQAMGCFLAVALAAVPYLIWRHAYYGYLLPSTYYAKVSGPLEDRVFHAAGQLGGIVFQEGLLAHLLVLAFVALLVFRRSGEGLLAALRRIPFEAGMAACLVLYWIYVGGDHLGERFLLVLYLFGIAAWLTAVFPRIPRRAQALLLVLLCSLQLAPLASDGRFAYGRPKYDHWVALGEFLKVQAPGRTLAIEGAGKVPFLSGLTTIDMLGLTDEYLAHRKVDFFVPGHNKYDADYVLSRKPDLIAAWVRTGDLDLQWGLTREKYRRAGYRLRYLVSVDHDLHPANIVDASGLTPDSIDDLLDRGFYYAVLERRRD